MTKERDSRWKSTRRAWCATVAGSFLATNVRVLAAQDNRRTFDSTDWGELADEATRAGEESLAAWFRQRVLPKRNDVWIAAYATSPFECPPVRDPAAGKRLWESALEQSRIEARALHDKARRAASRKEGEAAYRLLWLAHRADPSQKEWSDLLSVPSMLGEPTVQKGTRSLPDFRWPARGYWEVQSGHFRILTTAEPEAARQLARELERGIAIWRQVFFASWSSDATMADAIEKNKKPLAPAIVPLRVVLLPDRASYLELLAPHVPGVEQSTGYYAPFWNATFLYIDADDDGATRFHELTHQFLSEASRFRQSKSPGKQNGFWSVEGIACYAESIRWQATYATLGGWDAPRMNRARYRWLQLNHRREFNELASLGQSQLGQIDDLAEWYTDAATYVHWLLDPQHREAGHTFFNYLESVYRRGGDARVETLGVDAQGIADWLQVDDARIASLSEPSDLRDLCLGNTAVTEAGLSQLPPLTHLRWLDLAGLRVEDARVSALLAAPSDLERLNLERTLVTDQVALALQRCRHLSELDMTSTRVGDGVVSALAGFPQLRILWLTGTRVTDASIDTLAQLPALEQVDIQATAVTETGVERLQRLRPKLKINPLQVQIK